MEYSVKKKKFVDLTRKYIEDITPLLDVNKKTTIGNIRLFMYKAMIIQGWYSGSVSLDTTGTIKYPEKSKSKRKIRT